ncbi:MAG: hypothetical protein RL259_582 [Bacteroidota bacterium]
MVNAITGQIIIRKPNMPEEVYGEKEIEALEIEMAQNYSLTRVPNERNFKLWDGLTKRK